MNGKARIEGTPAQQMRLAAMNLLARREYSRHELWQKLVARFAEHREAIDAVLDRLADDDLQSDERFAESFVRARIQRGQGRLRIVTELRHKGVASHHIDTALAGADVDWFALAADVLERRFGCDTPCDLRERARRMRFLQQRGFGGDEIREALAATGDE